MEKIIWGRRRCWRQLAGREDLLDLRVARAVIRAAVAFVCLVVWREAAVGVAPPFLRRRGGAGVSHSVERRPGARAVRAGAVAELLRQLRAVLSAVADLVVMFELAVRRPRAP